MMVIGLTGSIASGKSTLAAMLRKAQVPVIDADELSRQVTAQNQPCLKKIIEVFGKDFLLPDETLDRKKLGNLVFSNPAALRQLELLVHPAIKSAFNDRLQKLLKQNIEFVVYVAPLIFEKNLDVDLDQIILVTASEELMIDRLKKRDDLSADAAKQRLAAQMSTADKILRADHIIENNGTLDELREKLAFTWKKITDRALNT